MNVMNKSKIMTKSFLKTIIRNKINTTFIDNKVFLKLIHILSTIFLLMYLLINMISIEFLSVFFT
jgi:hypothetical protein